MEFKEIVMQRYATKEFDGRMIDDSILYALLDLIRFAPSAFNLQPWKIKVVSASRIKKNLRPHSNNQQQITTCSHLLAFCANTELEQLVERVSEGRKGSGMPTVAIAQYTEMMKGYIRSMSPEQKLAFAREQCYIALGNAVNGAKALGIDSCPRTKPCPNGGCPGKKSSFNPGSSFFSDWVMGFSSSGFFGYGRMVPLNCESSC